MGVDPPTARGGDFQVRVFPQHTLPVNTFRAQLRLIPRFEGKVLPAVEIPIHAQILQDVCADPPNIAFGAHKTGLEFAESFTVRSRTKAHFTVQHIKIVGEGLSISKNQHLIGSSYLLRQKILKPGQQRGVVYLDIQTSDSMQEKLVLEASYFGLH